MRVKLIVKPARGRAKEIKKEFEVASAADLFAQLMDMIGYVWTAACNQKGGPALAMMAGNTAFNVSFAKIPTDPEELDQFCGEWWNRAECIRSDYYARNPHIARD